MFNTVQNKPYQKVYCCEKHGRLLKKKMEIHTNDVCRFETL